MVMQRLKAATRPFHDQIEASLGLMNPHISREHYIQYLRDAYGFYKPWEEVVSDGLIKNNNGLFLTCKLQSIKQDLDCFGESEESLYRLPICSQLPQLRDLSEIAGSMYVIEGATLGGQFIAKHIKQALGLSDEGCAFVSGYGKETAARWKAFGEKLEHIANDDNESIIIGSACDTFTAMHVWFSQTDKKSHEARNPTDMAG